MEKIPDEVSKQIEGEAELRYPVKNHSIPPDSPYGHSQTTFKHGCQFGYSLASKALSDANKEIEYLKKFIKEMQDDFNKEIGKYQH